MKKINYIITFLAFFLVLSIKVNAIGATNYFDFDQYDFDAEWEKIPIDIEGYITPTEGPWAGLAGPMTMIETSDQGLLILVSYRDSTNHKIDYPNGGVTNIEFHTKLIKLDKNYQKQWEKNYFKLGNWDNPDPSAITVETTANDIAELSDGSFVITGRVYGWLHSKSISRIKPDAFMARFDKDGNLMYEYIFHEQGFEEGFVVAALEDGGYIIKYDEPFEWLNHFSDLGMPDFFDREKFDTTDTKIKFHNGELDDYYYVVYDKDNNVVDYFSTSENVKLNDYNFKDRYAKQNLEQMFGSRYIEHRYEYSPISSYVGINSEGDIVRTEKLNGRHKEESINFYDFYSLELKRSINEETINKSDLGSINGVTFGTNGEMMYGNLIVDREGNLIYGSSLDELFPEHNAESNTARAREREARKEELDKISLVLSNGDLVRYDKYSNLYVKRPNKTDDKIDEDFAEFIIDGKKIEKPLGVFLENDRTYIDINNLCSVMGCTFERGEEDENKLIFRFSYDFKDTDSKIRANLQDRIKYTVVHELGSKEYNTYLEVQPIKNFILQSPTFDANTIDVTSKEVDGDIYVPLRFISEALGRYVDYNPEGENGKPVITISQAGEGEFYEKYDIAVSYDEYKNGDTLKNPLDTFPLNIELNKKLYGYGYRTDNNEIINIDKTIIVPTLINNLIEGEDLEYEEGDNSRVENNYSYGNFTSKDNWIEKDKEEFEDIDSFSFIVISNIEGYPFTKIVSFEN